MSKLDNPMLPLWIKYPEISRYSIGWRMGYGESYVHEFNSWYQSLSPAEQKSYEERYPSPTLWKGYYNDEDEDAEDEENSLFYEYGDYFIEFWRPEGEPLYSRQQLAKDYNAGKKLKFLYFWGHQPSADGSITKTCLSQWWMSDFMVYKDYCCMEQYMMAEKADLFGDKEMEKQIMASRSPKNIKALGRKVKNFRAEIWDKVKHSIILTGSYYKFTQNKKLLKFLLSTKGKILVEASPYDKVWGSGMGADHPNAGNPNKWTGENLLGFALMELRDALCRVYAKTALE